MSGSNTATVETLTAEVRVLVVGSRQVTLSVYGQLDLVEPNEIEPFGRVRPGRSHCSDGWMGGGVNRDCPGDCIDVVGRNDAGVLVRSCTPWSGNRRHPWESLPLIVLAGLR